jgi:CheY-like chemotaxis protein
MLSGAPIVTIDEFERLQAGRTRSNGSGASGTVGAAAEHPRVLIVDDDEMVGRALALTLRDECEVTLMMSGREVLERLETGDRFDLILCDLLMPGMTGMELYSELLRRWPAIVERVIFMTGGVSSPTARAFLASLTNLCLDKPIDPRGLRELVRTRTGNGSH